jgi:serine/threonine protein phosphatase PrpC
MKLQGIACEGAHALRNGLAHVCVVCRAPHGTKCNVVHTLQARQQSFSYPVKQGHADIQNFWAYAAEDTLVLIASDGLFANEERGGGGGLTNQEAVQLAGQVADADDAARRLVAAAQDAGSTDDVTVVLLRLK